MGLRKERTKNFLQKFLHLSSISDLKALEMLFRQGTEWKEGLILKSCCLVYVAPIVPKILLSSVNSPKDHSTLDSPLLSCMDTGLSPVNFLC